MILEIDNLLDSATADSIENFMLSIDFNWVYIKSISGPCVNDEAVANDPKIKESDGFMHIFIDNKQLVCPHAGIIRSLISAMEQRTAKTVKEVERSRAVLLYKNPTFGDFYQGPHTDYATPHMVMIYYVSDSDGDTIFFNEKHTGTIDNSKKTISQRITPKKNKCIIFDGLQYHAGSVPKNSHRMFININFCFEQDNKADNKYPYAYI